MAAFEKGRTLLIWGYNNQITQVYLSKLITKFNLQEKMPEIEPLLVTASSNLIF